MRRGLVALVLVSLVVGMFVSCATGSAPVLAEVEETTTPAVVEDKPVDEVPKNQIIFKGEKGKLELILDKDDMSAKLYSFGEQVKQGFWTSAAIGVSSNIQIFIDGKPVNLFMNPLTNEYSIEMQYESIVDILHCDMNSWFGKTRNFTALEQSSGEIICYGPSNFAYWTTMATDLAPYLVHNHSVGGVTDKQLLEAAPTMLYPFNPKVVMLLTGSNDYANITDISDVDAVVASLMDAKIKLYEGIHENLPEARIVVVGGMPTIKRAMFTEIVLIVNDRIKEYCDEHSDYLTFCSLGDLTYDSATGTYKEDRFLADGLHLTPEARSIMAERIIPVLSEIDAPAGPTVLEVQTCKLYDSVDKIPFYDGKADEPWFEVYQVESDKPNKALIILHGGGFLARSVPKESTAMAEYFSREYGYTCFVCYYRINTDYHAIVSDGIRFLKQIRKDAEKYNIDPNQICLMGFSAGGSLALATGQHYMDEEYLFSDELDQVDGRPDYYALMYSGTQLLSESRNKYLKWEYDDEMIEKYDYSKHVPEDMGPAFIAYAADDSLAEGNRNLISVFIEKGIDIEVHEFSHGGHGFSLGNNEETVTWMDLFADWFNGK